MTTITDQDLVNAGLDAQTLADVVNESATFGGDGIVHSRLGENLKTLAKILNDLSETDVDEGVLSVLNAKINTVSTKLQSLFKGIVTRVAFNGTDSYVTIANLDNDLFVNAFTVEFEGYSGGGNQCFVSRADFVGGAIFTQGNDVAFGSSSGWVEAPIIHDEFHIYRFVYDPGETGTDRYKIYIDDVQVTTTINSVITNAHSSLPNDVYVGRLANGAYDLDGVMQKLKIWSHVVAPDAADQTTNLVVNLVNVFGTVWENLGSGSDDANLFGTINFTEESSFTLTSLKQNQGFLTDGANGDITISGHLDELGDIEASFADGAYSTVSSNSSGIFSGTINVAAATGTLIVRNANFPEIKHEFTNIAVGEGYLVGGDSISEGRGTNAQSHGLASNLRPVVLREDNTWIEANDPVDTNTTAGSHWPLLAKMLTEDSSKPVWFVTTGQGSKDIAGSSAAYFNSGNAGYDTIKSQAGRAGNDFTEALFHLGPNAAVDATLTASQYQTALQDFISDLRTDVQSDLTLRIGCYGESLGYDNDAVREGIIDAVDNDANINAGPNLLGLNYSDNVHPKSDEELAITAGRWFAAMKGLVSPNIVSATTVNSTTVDLLFDADLDETESATFGTAAWAIDESGAKTITSVTRTAIRTVRIVTSDTFTASATVSFAKGETHVDQALPTSVKQALPSTVNTVTHSANPINPIYDFAMTAGASLFSETLDSGGYPSGWTADSGGESLTYPPSIGNDWTMTWYKNAVLPTVGNYRLTIVFSSGNDSSDFDIIANEGATERINTNEDTGALASNTYIGTFSSGGVGNFQVSVTENADGELNVESITIEEI